MLQFFSTTIESAVTDRQTDGFRGRKVLNIDQKLMWEGQCVHLVMRSLTAFNALHTLLKKTALDKVGSCVHGKRYAKKPQECDVFVQPGWFDRGHYRITKPLTQFRNRE